MDPAGRADLEDTLRALRVERNAQYDRLRERIRTLGEKQRRAESRLDSLRRQTDEARDELERVDRRYRKRQRLALEGSLRRAAAELRDPARGAWGDTVPLVASLRKTAQGGDELLLLVPVDAHVAQEWEPHAESAPLRIAMVAYATLVKLAGEQGVADGPARGSWGPHLALRLDLGPLDARRRRELEEEDVALLLEEHPRPWAGGGRERVPRLAWIPAELLDDPGFVPAGSSEP